MNKWLIALLVFFLCVFAWMGRYTIFPNSDKGAYVLDRFTGRITFYLAFKEFPIEKWKPAPEKASQPFLEPEEKRKNPTQVDDTKKNKTDLPSWVLDILEEKADRPAGQK